MIFKNSQQDVNIHEEDNVKVVSLKISGGADSAIVGFMLSNYVAVERPDIKIIPITTNHPRKPYQGLFAKRIIEFYKETFGDIFGKHYINNLDQIATNEDYNSAQTDIFNIANKNELIISSYSGITSNPPKDEMDKFVNKYKKNETGPYDDRNGKKFSVIANGPGGSNGSKRHLVNIDKKGVAELYNNLGLMDTLFPLTRSCEEITNDFSSHCEHCWFCRERYWGFGRYI